MFVGSHVCYSPSCVSASIPQDLDTAHEYELEQVRKQYDDKIEVIEKQHTVSTCNLDIFINIDNFAVYYHKSPQTLEYGI